MINFLCIFLPGFLGVLIVEKLRKEKFTRRQYLSYYIVFTLLGNTFVFWIIGFFFNNPDLEIFSAKFAAKYSALLISFTAALAYAIEHYRNCVGTPKFFLQKVDEAGRKIRLSYVFKSMPSLFLLFLAVFLFFTVNWSLSVFGPLDGLFFHLFAYLETGGKDLFYSFVCKTLVPSAIIVIFYFLLGNKHFFGYSFCIKTEKTQKVFVLLPCSFLKKYQSLIMPIVLAVSCVFVIFRWP